MSEKEIAEKLDVFFKPLIEKCCGKGTCNNCCCGCTTWNSHFRFIGGLDTPCHLEMVEEFRANKDAMRQYDALKAKYKWDNIHGFLIPGVGCKLPRTERPAYCQQVICHVMKPHNPDLETLMGLINELKEIRKKEGRIF